MAPHVVTGRSSKPTGRIGMGNKGKLETIRKKVRIRFYAPTKTILERLGTNGIVKARTVKGKSGVEYRGTFRGNLINLEHPDILRYYNAILRGIWNYYAFVQNKRALGRVFWVIRKSCALTLARKYKLKTQRGAFERFGKLLTYNAKSSDNKETTSISLYKPNLKKERVGGGGGGGGGEAARRGYAAATLPCLALPRLAASPPCHERLPPQPNRFRKPHEKVME